MNLPKAIAIITELRAIVFIDKCKDRKDAIKLLIEAGKFVEAHRRAHPGLQNSLLPSETPE